MYWVVTMALLRWELQSVIGFLRLSMRFVKRWVGRFFFVNWMLQLLRWIRLQFLVFLLGILRWMALERFELSIFERRSSKMKKKRSLIRTIASNLYFKLSNTKFHKHGSISNESNIQSLPITCSADNPMQQKS